jgi:hypothetical protein
VTGDDYVTRIEFAELLGVNYKQMSMYRSREKLPMAATHDGNRPLWRRDVVDTFLAEVTADPSILDRRDGNRGRPRFR